MNEYALSYFPYQQANLFDGAIKPSCVKTNSVAYAFWCRALYQRLCSILKFEGLPEGWQRAEDFLEAVIFGRGFAAVFDHEKYGTVFQPANLQGFDIYYQPTRALVANPYMRITRSLEIGKDCELLRISPDYHGVVSICSYYAEKLATLDGALNMNIINSKLAYVFGAKNKAAAQAVFKIFDLINSGQPTIVYDKSLVEGLGDEEPFEFIDRAGLAQSYLVNDMLQSHKSILDEFDSEVGIPSLGAAEKKERMIVDEANAKNADTSSRVSLWKESLDRSLKEVNSHFGLNITAKFVYLEKMEQEQNSLEDDIGRRMNEWDYQS